MALTNGFLEKPPKRIVAEYDLYGLKYCPGCKKYTGQYYLNMTKVKEQPRFLWSCCECHTSHTGVGEEHTFSTKVLKG